MEGGNGDFKFPLHCLHHLPRFPSWFPGGLWYRDRLTRGQTSPAGNVHEVGGPPRYLPVSAQGIRHIGQVQVPGYPRGIWCESQGPPPPPQVLEEATYDGTGRRVLWGTLPQGESWDGGGPTFSYHLQRGGGCIGLSLVIPGGGRGWVRQQGQQQRR